MRVSIVLPVFNEADYIEDCLDSILNSSRLPDEIVIIDNNCTDNTIELARKRVNVAQGKLNTKVGTRLNTKFVQESRQGVRFSRVTGFNAASGDYLISIDADSELHPDFIEVMSQELDKAGGGVPAASCLAQLSTRARSRHRSPFGGRVSINTVIFGWQKAMGLGWLLYGSGSIVRAEDYRQAAPALEKLAYENNIHEDMALGLILRKKRLQTSLVKRPLIGIDDRRFCNGSANLWVRLNAWPTTYKVTGANFLQTALTWVMVRILYVLNGVFWAIFQR